MHSKKDRLELLRKVKRGNDQELTRNPQVAYPNHEGNCAQMYQGCKTHRDREWVEEVRASHLCTDKADRAKAWILDLLAERDW